MRGSLSFKSHSQVNEYEVMTLGQLDLIFYYLRILNLSNFSISGNYFSKKGKRTQP